jgi:hypothetical protein
MNYYWNEETLNHFVELSKTATMAELSVEVISFVSNECDLEDGETEEMLVEDLLNQIYNLQRGS